jgi:hypothetical protein
MRDAGCARVLLIIALANLTSLAIMLTCARKPPIAGPITRAIARDDVT